MRASVCMRAAAYLAAAAGVYFGACAIGFDQVGVSSAEAKSYYTRKRVNGRWVTGRFAKRHASRPHRRVARHGGATRDPEPMVEEEILSAAVHGRAEVGSDPIPRRPASPSVPPTDAAAAPPVRSASELSSDESLRQLQEALQARARQLAAQSTGDTATVDRPGPNATGSLGPEFSSTRPDPRSVSFDFQSGLKTTVFTDGGIVSEPFDVASAKGLASAPPGSVRQSR